MSRNQLHGLRALGVDIHFFVEARSPSGRWERAEPLVPVRRYDKGFPYPAPGLERVDLYDARNRYVFGILQGNAEYGASELPHHRGLPVDVSSETQAVYDYVGNGVWGQSWLSLAELVGHDWSQRFTGTYGQLRDGPDGQTSRSVTAERSAAEWCSHFVDEVLPALHEFGSPEDVRVVFWFDS